MIEDANGNVYLTYEEYGKRYNVSVTAIKQRVHRGTLWCKRIGRKSYIWEYDVPEHTSRGRPKGSKNKRKI